jgi:glycosyltransferase involved in cell wall biosynthesis
METLTESPPRPSVTLVVPNYNHARYLAESLGSIAAQTHAPDQVLIIDDASTDDSLAVISRFVADNPTWRLIRHAKNTGVVPGQNESIRLVDTDWIGFLGADDALHPTYLERTLAQAAHFPQAGLICACAEIIGMSEARAMRPAILPIRQPAFLEPADLRKSLLVGDNYLSGTVSLYRRSALAAVGGFDEKLGSFADGFRARQLALTFGVFFLPEILGYWRIHGLNYSTVTITDPTNMSAKLAEIRALIADSDVFPPGYADLFERRIRFGAARIVISSKLATSAKAEHASALLDFCKAERLWLKLLLSFGGLGRIAALAWATLRTRPASLARLVGQIPLRQAIIAARAPYRPA